MLTLERSVITYLAIGMVQGLLLWLATSMGDPGVWYALITAVLVGGINLLLLGENIRQHGVVWLVLGLTAVMTAISSWVFWDGDEYWRSGSWLVGSWSFFAVVVTYVCTVFILSWPTREGRYPRYEDLFRHAWDTVFIVMLGLLLNGVFWALLLLWGGLFKMLGIVLNTGAGGVGGVFDLAAYRAVRPDPVADSGHGAGAGDFCSQPGSGLGRVCLQGYLAGQLARQQSADCAAVCGDPAGAAYAVVQST